MNYWLHRISYYAEVSYPLLEKGYLTIGFSDFSTQTFIENVLDGENWQERWKILESEFENIWGSHPRTRHNLWRFIEAFKKGDRILIPSSGVFSVYEIVSEKPNPIGEIDIKEIRDWHGNELNINNARLYRDEELIDLGFFWKVKPIATQISRYEFADRALTARMKIRNTNAWIGDIKDSIEKAIFAFNENKPINLYSQIIENNAQNILKTNPVLNVKKNNKKREAFLKYLNYI